MANVTAKTRKPSLEKANNRSRKNSPSSTDSVEYLQRVFGIETFTELQNDTVNSTDSTINRKIQRVAETDPNVVMHLQRTVGNQRTIQLLRDNDSIQRTPADGQTIQLGRTRNRMLAKMFGLDEKSKDKKKLEKITAQKEKIKAKEEERSRTSKPGMYRAQPGSVEKAGAMTFFEIPTTFKSAAPSNGRYLISERGAGAHPLILLGTPTELASWLNENSALLIANIIPDFEGEDPWDESPNENPTEIKMKITRTKGLVPVSRENVRSLTPVHDATQNIMETLTGFGTGMIGGTGGLTETLRGGVEGAVEFMGQMENISGRSSDSDDSDGMEPMYMVEFSIYGTKEIANRDSHGVDTGNRDRADRPVRETVISFGEIAGDILSGLG